ncbi:hypothetical protein BO83DRAFT_360835 [Aspergillus eucalypticola CBS 122712]|uniref:Ribonucleases P/MRP subunit Pop8-like domain-containing protein n=1 Tax=Aspergillus eucalypticola (strain CBS 122712 / IBT 29274) TaxID=1448314 RepID=A0A317VG58_ASPEC|nr:uncharacterized protein BO83DRAFT_360835 [Aspergillus eucalypticola CBS 122712]PWY73364.1 hypothetical protein BO83DRAFT_360835 [Aspergillus eucalypticola CBS 122712]
MSTITTTPSERKSSTNPPKTIHFTSRTPTWTYLKLQLINNPPTSTTSTPLDPLTARTYLSAALSQFLGLTGTSIPIDILKISPPSPSTVWTRVPRDDAAAVVAALSSWIGGSASTTTNTSGGDVGGGGSVAWRVCAKGNYLGALVNGGGAEVFIP